MSQQRLRPSHHAALPQAPDLSVFGQLRVPGGSRGAAWRVVCPSVMPGGFGRCRAGGPPRWTCAAAMAFPCPVQGCQIGSKCPIVGAKQDRMCSRRGPRRVPCRDAK
jgi:hypothetical protein